MKKNLDDTQIIISNLGVSLIGISIGILLSSFILALLRK